MANRLRNSSGTPRWRLVDRLVLAIKRAARITKVVWDRGFWTYLGLRVCGVSREFTVDKSGGRAKDCRARGYRSYEAYLAHQKSKLNILSGQSSFLGDGTNLSEYEPKFRRVLARRMSEVPELIVPSNVLCLGARLGAEVRAFRDLGFFSYGIDLNPGAANDAVLEGDFHNLAVPNGCVDAVFTNSLDHAFDISRVAREIYRVLKPEGVLVVEIALGIEEGERINTGFWESLEWDFAEDLLEGFGFLFERKGAGYTFDFPWAGKGFVLRPKRPEDRKASTNP